MISWNKNNPQTTPSVACYKPSALNGDTFVFWGASDLAIVTNREPPRLINLPFSPGGGFPDILGLLSEPPATCSLSAPLQHWNWDYSFSNLPVLMGLQLMHSIAS